MAEKTSFQSLVSNKKFANSEMTLPLVLGVDSNNNPVYADLAQMPHLLVIGRTGSGKTTFLQSVIMSLLHKFKPTECKLLIIDPQGVNFPVWNNSPHLIRPVVTEQDTAEKSLEWIVNEIGNRQHKDTMPYIVVVIDEIADLLIINKDATISCVQKICQKGKAVGIHLVVATQRIRDLHEDDDVAAMFANLPTRATFQLRTADDSELVLGETGAEKLSAHGEMLYSESGKQSVKIDVPWINESDIKGFVKTL